jgi:hypothetical protein
MTKRGRTKICPGNEIIMMLELERYANMESRYGHKMETHKEKNDSTRRLNDGKGRRSGVVRLEAEKK